MDRNIIEKDGFYFIHNFDSGNLGHVERVPTELIASTLNSKTNSTETPDYEFNLWTRPDCAGTEFENGNRTWFYFGVQATHPSITVRLNLINLNKQGKMYNQGMAPVTRTLPGKPQWERIKDRPVHSLDDNTFSLSFKYKTSENLKATTFFAFTYPFSFAELQIALYSIDLKMLPMPPPLTPDDIYYFRENVIYSLEGRRVDLLTISSYHGITDEREDRLKNLFPDNQERPFKFKNKKIIFMSARVHPGETPSSFVFNGFLTLLLSRNDPIAIQLRKLYVFKLIPFLNPDGVARGHYRTDTRGVNLNRVYLNPSLLLHPTVYASRALIRYYHFGVEKEDIIEEENLCMSSSSQVLTESDTTIKPRKVEPVKSKIKTSASPPKQLPVEKKSEKTKLVPEINNKETVVSVAHPSPEPPTEQDLILNATTLRSCLGVNLQLTSSSELSQLGLQASNPMKPLRETLKNSICLLMESNGSNADMALLKSRYPDIKMGTCKTCRKQKGDNNVPGHSFIDEHLQIPRPSRFISDIEEYREKQKQQIDMANRKSQQTEAHPPEDCFFCTNCFKRFITSNGNEEIKVPSDNSLPSMAEADESTEKEIANFDMTKMDIAKNRSPSPSAQTSPTRNRQSAPSSAKTPPAQAKSQPIPVANKKPTPNAKAKSIGKESSGLYLYIDLHGHASKKGIFMYGNHFTEAESSVECMLLPRIMSLNNTHFHFSSCNFTERNMYLKDRRDGMSREGSGRVAVLKATGLVRSYTLECNYNTGRLVNVLPPSVKDGPTAPSITSNTPLPPKYTPHIYEEVGYSLGASILDLTGHHPNSRIPCSEHRTLGSLRDWLRTHQKTLRPQTTATRLRPKTSSPIRVPLFNKAKGIDERKENAFASTKTDTEKVKRPIPVFRQDLCNIKIAKKPEPVKSTSKTRISETETKSSLNSKRRNILAIRKPNTSKTQISAIIKAKVITRRSAEDNARNAVTSKLSKRSFNRSLRGSRADNIRRTLATSSSNDMINGNWDTKPTSHTESITSGKRRPFPTTSSTGLKKFRLKSVM